MSDTPERRPRRARAAPARSRARRPRSAPVERFTSPPSTRSVELTPERAAQVVRQSSNARWVGFLAVVVVILFITIYWFYELAPLGFREPRLDAEAAAQQVTSVERGYNLYEANCARCHGVNGSAERSAWHRAGAQPPGQAVRPPVGRLPEQHDDRGRPLRLRQPQLDHADLVQRGPARPARSTTSRSRT